jgi:hypothetical protein
MRKGGLGLLGILLVGHIGAQVTPENCVWEGKLRDRSGNTLPGASVVVTRTGNSQVELAQMSDAQGDFRLELPAGPTYQVRFSFVGFEPEVRNLTCVGDQQRRLDIRMEAGVQLGNAEVIGEGGGGSDLRRIDPRVATRIPSPRGTIEDLLIQAPVNFNSELSSSYNVRGGSFDENLIVVNDVEVYRPFLVRAGQQEGLSFPNPDMVESIRFSGGGFEAKYGDKMSSVLDIRYRRPTQRHTRVTASMLGVQLQHEGRLGFPEKGPPRLLFNTGFRYRDNSYVLGSLDDSGEYQPRYVDLQAYAVWDPDGWGPWEVEWLGMYGANRYRFLPATRQTDVGNITEALRLTIFFEGQEVTGYQTGFGSMSVNRATESDRLRFLLSAFATEERETFDILGAYRLDELDRDLGSDALGEVLTNRGVGAFLDHARNRLRAQVTQAAVKGTHIRGEHTVEWGAQTAWERFQDALSEWSLVDSAGFVTPHPQDSIGYLPGQRPVQTLELQDVIRAQNYLQNFRAQLYLQDTWTHEREAGTWMVNLGWRLHFWDYAPELVGGPRAQVRFTPTPTPGAARNEWRLSGGYYWQPPFYRELRALDGAISPEVRSQLSLHTVLGWDRYFTLNDRPFKWSSELYFKDLRRLIPYEVENVRQRYFATNNARGYAAGADFMLNGEFIPGVESWLRLSALQTMEDLSDDGFYDYLNAQGQVIIQGFTLDDVAVDSVWNEPGWIPRPTDQRFNASLLFQDEMPRNPDYKVLLSLYFGTGLPFGPPGFERHLDILRTPPYRRVDIGFSRELFTGAKASERAEGVRRPTGFISLEIFNILGIRNTINHTWIEDVNGRLYAISNYLTDRRVNLKLGIEF